MVKRLRHHPFTVVSRVRIPVGSPLLFLPLYKRDILRLTGIPPTVVSFSDSSIAYALIHLENEKYFVLSTLQGTGLRIPESVLQILHLIY